MNLPSGAMSLQQYKSQENPVKMPWVVLTDNDIRVGETVKCKSDTITQIWVNGFAHTYVLKNMCGTLYTSDKDGNPSIPSCFNIYYFTL